VPEHNPVLLLEDVPKLDVLLGDGLDDFMNTVRSLKVRVYTHWGSVVHLNADCGTSSTSRRSASTATTASLPELVDRICVRCKRSVNVDGPHNAFDVADFYSAIHTMKLLRSLAEDLHETRENEHTPASWLSAFTTGSRLSVMLRHHVSKVEAIRRRHTIDAAASAVAIQARETLELYEHTFAPFRSTALKTCAIVLSFAQLERSRCTSTRDERLHHGSPQLHVKRLFRSVCGQPSTLIQVPDSAEENPGNWTVSDLSHRRQIVDDYCATVSTVSPGHPDQLLCINDPVPHDLRDCSFSEIAVTMWRRRVSQAAQDAFTRWNTHVTSLIGTAWLLSTVTVTTRAHAPKELGAFSAWLQSADTDTRTYVYVMPSFCAEVAESVLGAAPDIKSVRSEPVVAQCQDLYTAMDALRASCEQNDLLQSWLGRLTVAQQMTQVDYDHLVRSHTPPQMWAIANIAPPTHPDQQQPADTAGSVTVHTVNVSTGAGTCETNDCVGMLF